MSKIDKLIKELCPNGVEYKKLGEIASFRRGSFPQPYGDSRWYDGEDAMPFIQVADVADNMKLVENTKNKISKVAQKMSVFVPEGTVIVTLQGSIGRVAITQYDSYVDRTLAIFEKLDSKIEKKYFAYQLYKIFELKKKTARGSTIKTITKEEFTEFKIPIPPVQIQKEIVLILDKFAELEVELEAELEARKKQYEYYINNLLNGEENTKLNYTKLEDLIDYIQPTKYIVASTEYNKDYETPVLTAGQTFILGYSNEKNGIYKASIEEPVIIFDDFTTSNHWVNFKFKVKSSALKILVPKEGENTLLRYIYYCIKNITYTPGEHSRQWIQKYSKIEIPVPSLRQQQRIVNILDKFDRLVNDISEGLPAEIEARRKQCEYYRNKLLSFKEIEGE